MQITSRSKRKSLIDEFVRRNSQINLSAIRHPEQIYIKHILDTIELNTLSELPTESLQMIDIGTGWGFPLLPLAVTHPNWTCVGLDTRKKKCKAVQAIADALDLANLTTIWSRIEHHQQQYDLLTARAVAYADQLIQRSLPLVKKGGLIAWYKQYTTQEDDLIFDLIRTYQLDLIELHHYHLPDDLTQRVIYLIKK